MTTYFSQSVTCANCQQSSNHQMLGSTNSFGSSDLDLRPPPMRRSTMNAWIQQCPHCQYVAPDISTKTGDVSLITQPGYRQILEDQHFPDLARQFLARAHLVAGSDPVDAGWANLHAAWVCDDASQEDLARECRKKAAKCFASMKPFADNEQGITQGAVLVDVLRRSGGFTQAGSECNELLARPTAQGILRQVLEFQNRLIAESDTAEHQVAEATGNA